MDTNPCPHGHGRCEDRATECEHYGKHNSVRCFLWLEGHHWGIHQKGGYILLGTHQFPGATVTKYYNLGGLEQQKLILSHFWRPELQNQGVSRAHSLWEF